MICIPCRVEFEEKLPGTVHKYGVLVPGTRTSTPGMIGIPGTCTMLLQYSEYWILDSGTSALYFVPRLGRFGPCTFAPYTLVAHHGI